MKDSSSNTATIGFTTKDAAEKAAFQYDRAQFNGKEVSVKVIKN
jgi:hypothetical protein